MKIWKDKKGNKLTFKEFMKRWGKGIEGITPLQKMKTQILGTRIMLLGMFLGLLVSIYGWKDLWWVGIILIGALINTGVQYLALRQQKKLLENLEKQFNLSEFDNSNDEIPEEDIVIKEQDRKEGVEVGDEVSNKDSNKDKEEKNKWT